MHEGESARAECGERAWCSLLMQRGCRVTYDDSVEEVFAV